ncbi:hypothetical protein OIU79_019900 [Salix purpurea]|uniref:Uncharacterized protein n=1 Tax=Salix purpurea TaxID=77065 RepID=A0A9Q0P2C5_SALPP|nr:hypothetical protein OIU79_019900 [Salix purpurea]
MLLGPIHQSLHEIPFIIQKLFLIRRGPFHRFMMELR